MTGSLDTSNWVTAQGDCTKLPGVPVDWPPPQAVDASAEAKLVLGTTAPPKLVLVKAYRDMHRKSGEPTSDPAATYQCNQFSEPRCAFSTRVGTTIIDDLPSATTAAPYIAVFCTWFVPPDQQSQGKSPNSNASASWLFPINVTPLSEAEA